MLMVQKIFYFHVPSWMAMYAGARRLRRRERRLSLQGQPAGRSRRGRRGRTGRAVRPIRPGHRIDLGPKGLGRVVAMGRAADDGPAARADLLRATCSCGNTAARVPKSWRPASRCSAWHDAVIVYKSVEWWRTVHPVTTVVSTLAPAMYGPLSVLQRCVLLLFGVLLTARVALENRRGRAGRPVSRDRGTVDDSIHRFRRLCRSPLTAASALAAQPPARRRANSNRFRRCRRRAAARAPLFVVVAYSFIWIATMVYVWSCGSGSARSKTRCGRSSGARQRSDDSDGWPLHFHPGSPACRPGHRLDSRRARGTGCLRRRAQETGRESRQKSQGKCQVSRQA